MTHIDQKCQTYSLQVGNFAPIIVLGVIVDTSL